MNIPVNHILFIPLALSIGFALGWKLGANQMWGQWQRAEERRKKREEEE